MTKKSTHAEIRIADIVVDAHTQARSAMSEEAIDRYTDVLENEPSGEWPFEHLDVFCDDAAGPNGGRYVLADGFHRLEAAKRNGNWDTVPCSVHSGDHIAARLFSITANDGHGVPMTRKDKRDNFVWLQQHFPELTREEQAIKLGVSERTLHRIVASLRGPATPENVVTTTSSGNAKKAANKKPERDKYCHVAGRTTQQMMRLGRRMLRPLRSELRSELRSPLRTCTTHCSDACLHNTVRRNHRRCD
jgi:hypothetical protein